MARILLGMGTHKRLPVGWFLDNLSGHEENPQNKNHISSAFKMFFTRLQVPVRSPNAPVSAKLEENWSSPCMHKVFIHMFFTEEASFLWNVLFL